MNNYELRKRLSLQKQKSYAHFSDIIQWGRRNPILFAEHMFGIKLMDYQKWVFMETWTKPYAIWLMCRAAGKTALMAVYLMTRMLLIPNYHVFVAGNSGAQACTSFMKLESIAMGREPSFKDVTDVFEHEVRLGKNNDRFKHAQGEYSFSLYNESSFASLTSNTDALRGKRGGIWYDESAWIPESYMSALDQFANVSASYSLKVDDDGYLDPQNMPIQLIYTSSAGPADMPFFKRFHEFSKGMFAGDPRYFVCNIDVDTVMLHTTVDGKAAKSHLNEDKIKAEIENNPEAAERELYNHFMHGGGRDAVVPSEVLVRNSSVRPPVLHNDTGKRKFIMAYDPARNYDNSILGIAEVIDNARVGYMLHIVNIISMVDVQKEQKTPLPMPEQLDRLRQMMIRYNGERAAEWENIELWIDAGSGGAPRSGITDHLLDPWTDSMGIEHRGVIDPIDPQYEDDRFQRKDNAPIVRLLEPKKYKTKIFGALEEMTGLNLIKFPDYDGRRDTLMLEDAYAESGYREYQLSTEEKEALVQIELGKTELRYIVRTEQPATRSVSYDLVREKRNKMHDDRAYVLAMLAYALWEKRNQDLRAPKKVETGPLLTFRAPNPYGNRRNHRPSHTITPEKRWSRG